MSNKPSTYGAKPRIYVLDGERYYVGADVGNYLKCHRGKLYKHYPNMWRRVATQEEKRLIHEMNGGAHALSSNVMLVKADEVEEIFAGNEEKYRGGGKVISQLSTPGMAPTLKKDNSTPNL
uniref:GIY-YIG homing endonuclease n=1 Tax=Panagrolaimus sp. JU765 TaxID=591449 RepID=A0AC34RCD4_9BILA